ncbi:hypothetical protein HGRIS_010621 [Hohenbuehelia grisea]|uniref:FHA domain-containing protein n=1 Tax=Hohenbuehelia grisea TaxID=104357 RepID=A0ABR3IXC8_9AGAR
MSALDDEIQYMGTRSVRGGGGLSLFGNAHARRRVTGFKMHVDSHGDEPSQTLTFHENIGVVQVGRKPGADRHKEPMEATQDMALFRCAVVSRKHAKITFDDEDGCAYITDLRSHHGTYLRKPGELDSSRLRPDNPFVLVDGDIVTFGKPVGRDRELVRPVTARVELLHSEIRPLIVPSRPLAVEHPARPIRRLSFPRSASGRYGVHDSDSPSSQSSSSSSASSSDPVLSDRDSDVEELSISGPAPQRHGGLAYEFLRRLLPPARSPINLVSTNTSSRSESRAHSPSIDCPAPVVIRLSSGPAPETDAIEYVDNHELFESSPQSPPPRAASVASSNMDLSPPPPEPTVIGAWPSMRLSTPQRSRPQTPECGSSPSPAPQPPSNRKSIESLPRDEMRFGLEMEELMADIERSIEQSNDSSGISVRLGEPSVDTEAYQLVNATLTGLKPKVDSVVVAQSEIKGEVEGLRSELELINLRFNAASERSAKDVSTTKERVDKHFEEICNMQTSVSALLDSKIPELQAQLQTISSRSQAEAEEAGRAMITEEFVLKALSGRDDLVNGVATVRDLVNEMQSMRAGLEVKIQEEVSAVQEACKAAVASIELQVNLPFLNFAFT